MCMVVLIHVCVLALMNNGPKKRCDKYRTAIQFNGGLTCKHCIVHSMKALNILLHTSDTKYNRYFGVFPPFFPLLIRKRQKYLIKVKPVHSLQSFYSNTSSFVVKTIWR